MQHYKMFFCGASPNLATTALISLYNNHIHGPYSNFYPPHISKSEEMNCVFITLRGHAEVHLKNGKIINLTEKSVFFSKLSEIHTTINNCEHWHFTCSWFIPQGINLPVNKIVHIPDLDVSAENEAANFIIRLFQTRIEHNVKYANSYFCCRLLELLNKTQYNTVSNSDFVEQALIYINRNIESSLSVKDIAQHFHYSEKHIFHSFKSALNTTPKQFINGIKLTNIAHLLATTSISLQELSNQYNYASVSHLVNSFKKKYGITPTVYRQQNSETINN